MCKHVHVFILLYKLKDVLGSRKDNVDEDKYTPLERGMVYLVNHVSNSRAILELMLSTCNYKTTKLGIKMIRDKCWPSINSN